MEDILADSTNIYLIADDYISYKDAPTGQRGTTIKRWHEEDWTIDFGEVHEDYPDASWIKSNSKGKKWLTEFLNSYPNSTNVNILQTAYMMDTNVWNTYAGEDAEYAMGGPTIEMFCASYRDTHSKYIEYRVLDGIGYEVRWIGDLDWKSYIVRLPENEFNSIYRKKDSSKTGGMWLASPSSIGEERCAAAGHLGDIGYSDSTSGLRPLVCLKSNVQIGKVSEGVYKIVK